MSTNATNPGPTSPLPVQSTPDPNAIIHPSLISIMTGHTFLTLLLPLLIALFYFSTPQSRRRPIFILNVVAIILAFIGGVMIDTLAIHSILDPPDPWPSSVNVAIGTIGVFQYILVDLILLVRLISVYPLRRLGPTRFAILTSLPILLKITRVVNLIIFIKVLSNAARGSEDMAVVWATAPYLKIEWSAQMVDNVYASLAFLWWGNGQGITSKIYPNRATFAQRIRTLCRIALSSFIIPSVFSIAQLVVVYRNVDVLIVNEIVLVNTMLAVFGAVLATVWAGDVGRRGVRIDLWEDEFQTDDYEAAKHHPHTSAFPGLGTWHAASSPPTLEFGSTGHTVARVGTGYHFA